jgi:hypothetical protein
VDRHTTSKQELDDLRSVVTRNLADAAITALSADNRFGLAYEAGLLLAKMAIAAAGYRVKRVVSDRDAGDLLREVTAFGSEVEAWLGANHPHLV